MGSGCGSDQGGAESWRVVRGVRVNVTFPFMPKRPKLPEADLHAMIGREARYRIGCKDFVPAFTLRKRVPVADGRAGSAANWEMASTRNADTWPPDCAQAFAEAVARAQRSYDVVWTMFD